MKKDETKVAGGKARAVSLTAEKRSEIAKKLPKKGGGRISQKLSLKGELSAEI